MGLYHMRGTLKYASQATSVRSSLGLCGKPHARRKSVPALTSTNEESVSGIYTRRNRLPARSQEEQRSRMVYASQKRVRRATTPAYDRVGPGGPRRNAAFRAGICGRAGQM